MKFGPLPIAESEGVFLAQAIRRPGLTLRKGEWIGAGQIAALQAAHIAEIVAARIEPGEVDENTAALVWPAASPAPISISLKPSPAAVI